ncbi:tail fiber domain-containing protein [Escherichia coli]
MWYSQKLTTGTKELRVNGACIATAFTQSSDRDLKENIQVIPDATAALRKMSGYTYTLKEDGMPHAGVIAQEAMEAIPEAVGSQYKYPEGDEEGLIPERYYTVDYSAVTGLLVQVCREADERITTLEERIANLEALIKSMAK